MRRSWIVEKFSDGYQFWYRGVPVEGGGRPETIISDHYLRNRATYFVAYEGRYVSNCLCVCASDLRRGRVTRLSHVYSWADGPWVPFIMWGA